MTLARVDRAWLVGFVGLLCTALPTDRSKADPFLFDEFTKSVRGWDVGVVMRQDATFFPQSCLALRDDPDGTRLALSHDGVNWTLGIFGRGMREVQAWQPYMLVLAVDGQGWRFEFRGRVEGPDRGVEAQRLPGDFMEAFKAGSTMQLIQGQRIVGQYSLSGSTAAALALEECGSERWHLGAMIPPPWLGDELSQSGTSRHLATLYDMILFAAFLDDPDTARFSENVAGSSIKRLVASGVVTDVHDCTIEFRAVCQDALNGGSKGSEVVQEWGEWVDATVGDRQFRRSFVDELVRDAETGGYTLLSDAEIRAFEAAHPGQTYQLPYGSRIGMNFTIFDYGGIGSSDAWIEFRHTWRNALDVCRDYTGDPSEACVRRGMDMLPRMVTVSADCETGRLIDHDGRRYRYLGPSVDRYREHDVMDLQDQIILESAMASGLPVILARLEALCPDIVGRN